MNLFPLDELNNITKNYKKKESLCLREKYTPILLNELEEEYSDIEKYILQGKNLIINGSNNIGKKTIIKLYLNILNYDYNEISDYTLKIDNIKDKIIPKGIQSFFIPKKSIILFSNFDLFEKKVKEYIINSPYQFILITTSYLNININYIYIKKLTKDYLLNLYCNIYFLEKNENCNFLPIINNLNELFSHLEINLLNNELQIDYTYITYTINDLIKEKKIDKRMYIIDKLYNQNEFQLNFIYNIDSIDLIAESYTYLCESLQLYNLLDYYTYISYIGLIKNLDSNKTFINKHISKLSKKKIIDYNIPKILIKKK